MTILPRGFVEAMACSNVGCTPATSKLTSTPPGTKALMASTALLSAGLITSVAPISSAFCRRTADKSTTIIFVAPAALAAAATRTPIGPAP